MKRLVCSVLKTFILFLIGGLIYFCIELLWRGYSHLSMFILGGLCFIIIGKLNEGYLWDLGLLQQSIIGALVITVLEFLVGLVVNIYLKLNVWDYSNLPLNILGQVCLPFTLGWILLSGVAIIVDDYLRYFLFKEEKPKYTLL